MSCANPVLELRHLTKVYRVYEKDIDRLKEVFTGRCYHKEFIANDDISFELYANETLGIIGVNGAGKSTLLKMVAGVIEPTAGEIIRHGRITALLELGTGFNPQLSGRENIFLNGTLIGMTKAECQQKMEDIIAFSELGDYIDEPILTYSSGMAMRLAFSIAIFSEPQILIVDEALSVGDAHFQAKCTRALRERKAKQMSIIYVSHDLNSLKLLCDRIILLNQGKVVEQGEPEAVINRYNYLIAQLNEGNADLEVVADKQSAFGNLQIEITHVEVKGEASQSNILSSGEKGEIAISILAHQEAQGLTVGIMIRDRFGQDIFGTNTFYHHLPLDFEKGNAYLCKFKMPFNIGPGKYSLTVAIHDKETHLEKCYHWIDHAVEIEIAGVIGPSFSGICRLEPSITFEKIS